MEQPETCQFGSKCGGVSEYDATHATRCRRLHIRFAVIDVNRQSRLECKSLQEKLKDTWIRFQQFHFTRKHHSPEPFQEREPLQSRGVGLSRPVAQRV